MSTQDGMQTGAGDAAVIHTETSSTVDPPPVLHWDSSKVLSQGQHKLIQLWSRDT